jgi:hypothetical protein
MMAFLFKPWQLGRRGRHAAIWLLVGWGLLYTPAILLELAEMLPDPGWLPDWNPPAIVETPLLDCFEEIVICAFILIHPIPLVVLLRSFFNENDLGIFSVVCRYVVLTYFVCLLLLLWFIRIALNKMIIGEWQGL